MFALSRQMWRFSFLCTVTAGLLACSDDSSTNPTTNDELAALDAEGSADARLRPNRVASVEVTPDTATLAIGDTLRLKATPRNSAGTILTGKTVRWRSTQLAVATVGTGGKVRAQDNGNTLVIADVGGILDTARITVGTTTDPGPGDPAPVASVTVAPTSTSLAVGGTATFTATMRDASGNTLTGRVVTWTSAASAVASISSTGVVTGNSAGSTTVQATSEGRSGSASVTVTASAPAPVASVTVAPTSTSLAVGGTAAFTATLRDAGGNTLTGRAVTWTSASSAVATVTSTGVATGNTAGSTTVQATSEGRSGSASVTVTAPPPPPTGGSVFQSDWTTATGNTNSAMSDGGRWDIIACNAYNVLNVIPGSQVGFAETPNVLRVQMRGGSQCGMLQRTNALPLSTTHYGRFYVRNDENGSRNGHASAYNNVHGGSGADIQAVPWSRDAASNGSGRWMMTVGGGSNYPYDRWDSPALTNGQWYRYEWRTEYVTSTTVRIWPRIYDAAGTLLYDERHFREHDFGPMTLGQWYAASSNNVIRLESASHARHFGIGNEGPGTAPDTRGYWYYGKFALGTAGWLGR